MSGILLTHHHLDQGHGLDPHFSRFFYQLGGPTVLHLEGRDKSRTRVVITLLHGNEPSGIKAIHRLISENFVPQTNCKFVIASVVAARTDPMFTHRMLPNQRDLNRCFNGPYSDLQGQLAKAIAEQLDNWQPEAIIDLHNTSGSGPAFSVSVSPVPEAVALASHFTHRMIHTDIRLGSVMEQDFSCPIVTIEAGGAEDHEADENAYNGLLSLLGEEDIFIPQRDMEVLYHPRRLELKADARIEYAESFKNTSNITIRQDVEKHNFGITTPAQTLGWIDEKGLDHMVLDDPSLEVSDYFSCENGQFQVLRPTKLFMVTTRPDIAKSDCLFYFVEASEN